MITHIAKRSGETVPFQIEKILKAVLAAMKAINQVNEAKALEITQAVRQKIETESHTKVPAVELIQDYVEKELMREGLDQVAKAFIIYRQHRAESRVSQAVFVHVQNTIGEYLNKLDWRVNANSNQGYSLGGLMLNTSGKVTANYWLSHIYPPAVGQAHRDGDYHIHDLDMFAGYCAGWSLRVLLEEGFNGVPNKTESNPPKHLSTAVSQMVNFLGTLQNEWAGAQAFSSFDTYLAPFVKKYKLEKTAEIKAIYPDISAEKLLKYVEEKTYDYVHQNIQAFVFNLNVPSRWGTQTPFTNITLDWVCPEDLRARKLKLGGVDFSYSFGELQAEMDIVNKAYMEVMTAGDAKGRVFTFPIPTYNITKDFDWEDPKTIPLFEMTAKYGMPYFQNFINSDMDPNHIRSMCCRLQLNLDELLKRGNGLFGSAEMTGSIGVVTLSAPRLGYLYKGNKEAFFQQMSRLMDLAKVSLEIKRKEIQKWMDQGLFPYSRRYLGRLDNHFSTIGINGLNEAIRNFTEDEENISTLWGQDFAEEVLLFMQKKLKDFQAETGHLYNLEATPAEGTTYRFAKEDKARFPGILQAGTEENPYYTNSSQLPVEYTEDAFEALMMQDRLQTKYTGGTVLHLYMGERISDPIACRTLVRTVLTQFHLPYITITPTFSICPEHGYLAGEHDFCPICDALLGYTGTEWQDTVLRQKYDSRQTRLSGLKA